MLCEHSFTGVEWLTKKANLFFNEEAERYVLTRNVWRWVNIVQDCRSIHARRRASRWSFGDQSSLKQATSDSNLTITRRGPRVCVAILSGRTCFVSVLVAAVSDAENNGAV